MDNSYPQNQFAPIYQAGIPTPSMEEVGYRDEYYDQVYSPANGILAASAVLENEKLQIDRDADFYLTGWYIAKCINGFLIELADSTGFQLTDGYVSATSISFDGSRPSPLSPAHPLPAGSLLQIKLRNLSGSENAIQIVFKGYKRFRAQAQ